jgi:hypothetical protein
MATKFVLTRDINGYNGFGIPFTQDNYKTTLAANVAQTVTVPDEYQSWLAIFSFSPGSDIYVALNTTATVAGASFAQSASQLNPAARYVQAGDTLSFITGDASNPVAEVSFYVAPPFTN